MKKKQILIFFLLFGLSFSLMGCKKSELTETEAKLIEAEAKLAEIESKLVEIETEAEIKETEVEVKETETEVKETEVEVKETETEVKETEAEVKETETEVKETETEVKETEVKVKETESSLKEHSFKDFYVILDGKRYEFPLKVQTLLDDGWIFKEEDLTTELESGSSTFGIYGYDEENQRIGFEAINFDEETKTVKDCYVCGFSASVETYKYKTPDFVLPWGAILGETNLEEFDAFYTSPSRTHNGGDDELSFATREFSEDSTSYWNDNRVEYRFTNGILEKISIDYLD